MTSETPAHDFLLPGLVALVQEAQSRGIARDVAVAVLTDLVTGPQFNDAAPDPAADSEPPRATQPSPERAATAQARKIDLVEQAITTGNPLEGRGP